jgi:hypothetical protein
MHSGRRHSLMRTPPLLLVALAALVLAGAACSDEGSDDRATDPAGNVTPSPSASASGPATPVPSGPVTTRNLATVMDTGSPELCMGPIAESYPPQCGGPALIGWDWADHKNTFEQQGDVRWGTYLVTGSWDGASMTATEAIPGALYDPAMPSPTPTPPAATAYSNPVLEEISEQLRDQLPGYLGSYGGEGTDGHVLADVLYDDGSLQEWADTTYGENVVVVSSALVDAG